MTGTSIPSWSSAGADQMVIRPVAQPARQHSDTTTLSSENRSTAPAADAHPIERRGLSAGTLALAKEALQMDRRNHTPQGGDRVCQFFNGLQWLLDSTLEARPAPVLRVPSRRRPLTEDAVEAFNILNESPSARRIQELDDHEDEEQERVRAWVARQSDVVAEEGVST